MTAPPKINTRYCTDRVRVDYPHVGLFDPQNQKLWIAKKRWTGTPAIRTSHARLLHAGSAATSTADKDHYICYWFYTPNSGEGYVHGYPIEWEEAHLLIRSNPTWDYRTQNLLPPDNPLAINRNLDHQHTAAKQIFTTYTALTPNFPISYHLIGPRPTDSMFYINRQEPTP